MSTEGTQSELQEITIEVPTQLLLAAQEVTGKGIPETVIAGLELLVSEGRS